VLHSNHLIVLKKMVKLVYFAAALLVCLVGSNAHPPPQPKIELPKIELPKKEKPKKECKIKSLTTLYRLYSGITDAHIFTTKTGEASRSQTGPNHYNSEGSPGQVARDDKECDCGLKPVYRVFKNFPPYEDRLLTNDLAEANRFVANGYKNEGVAFYCPQIAGKCGATLPFKRYYRGIGPEHFYTTSDDEANKNVLPYGGKAEGILCYIWPTK
jgi:hypothetical protein